MIIRYEDSTIRGFAEASQLGTIEQLLRNAPEHPLDTIKLKLIDTGEEEVFSTKSAKAVFFVKTFEGDLRHRALHFHEHAPVIPGLWVRVFFHDGEMIEGIISNTREYVLDDGFFLMPTDPNGNNTMAYILKNGLKDFHVLGMRTPSKNLPKL